MRIGSLFSGYGGLDLAVEAVLDGDLAWVCDNDKSASAVLAQRFPGVPNLDDIAAVDWRDVEPVDVLTGGFPCQDISHAGRGVGIRAKSRSGLWGHMAYAIEALRPRLVVIENVKGILNASASSDVEPCPWCLGNNATKPLRALGAVLGDLAELGFDAEWIGLRASDVGAPHERFRIFLVAEPADARGEARALRAGLRASRETGIGRGRPDDGAPTAPDADEPGRQGNQPTRGRLMSPRRSPADPGGFRYGTRPDPGGMGRVDGGPQNETRHGEWSRAESLGGDHAAPRKWGKYAAAVERWEDVLGRAAPDPVGIGPKGGTRLAPEFVEWMQGLPAGWVTDVPEVSWRQQLTLLGNGVVPMQAAAALSLLLQANAEEAIA